MSIVVGLPSKRCRRVANRLFPHSPTQGRTSSFLSGREFQNVKEQESEWNQGRHCGYF